MISDKVYELGLMLGLDYEDIRKIISNKQTNKTNLHYTQTKEIYPKGATYGTICINDI